MNPANLSVPGAPLNQGAGNVIRAIRGPVMLIALGSLLALDQFGSISFGRTWPALLILFGLFKLVEYTGSRNV